TTRSPSCSRAAGASGRPRSRSKAARSIATTPTAGPGSSTPRRSRMLDETHDPGLRSWVESANVEGTDFPIQNLPLGRFRPSGSDEPLRAGVAIGDRVLDLRRLSESDAVGGDLDSALRVLAEGEIN